MRVWSVLLALALVATGTAAWGQQTAEDPPEILSAELALKTVLESDRLEATFVIVDTDKVTEVTIDGQKQSITPGDTVQITRTFVFKQDVTRVKVTATDEAGHSRTVVYTVFRPGVDPNAVAEEPAAEKLRWFGSYDVKMESDSNPARVTSTDGPLGSLIPLPSELPPLPSAAADTRSNLLLSGGASKGKWTGYGGIWRIGYSDDANADLFDVMAIFLGGIGRFELTTNTAFQVGYQFTDLNIGASDYFQSHLVSPAYIIKGDDGSGGTTDTTLAFDMTAKSFNPELGVSNATDMQFRWDVQRVRANKLDRRRRVITIGQASEGSPETEQTYVTVDYDWRNRWETGLLWDIGWGFAYRDFAPTSAGAVRADLPVRFSTGLGWQFRPELRVMAAMRYDLSLSTSVSKLYERVILGVGVNGKF